MHRLDRTCAITGMKDDLGCTGLGTRVWHVKGSKVDVYPAWKKAQSTEGAEEYKTCRWTEHFQQCLDKTPERKVGCILDKL